VLPCFYVAPLEAGGRPLLSPPNAPHLVLTIQDCVMVEERRIFRLFLDDVDLFLRRAHLWSDLPIMYPFISETLASTEGVAKVARFLHNVINVPAPAALAGRSSGAESGCVGQASAVVSVAEGGQGSATVAEGLSARGGAGDAAHAAASLMLRHHTTGAVVGSISISPRLLSLFSVSYIE
jgi:hypothetical protein